MQCAYWKFVMCQKTFPDNLRCQISQFLVSYTCTCIKMMYIWGYIKIATYRNTDINIATLPIDQNSDISKLINWKVYIKIN